MHKRLIYGLIMVLAFIGVVLVGRIIEPQLFAWATQRIGRAPTPNATLILNRVGWGSLLASMMLLVYLRLFFSRHQQIASWIKQVAQKFNDWLDGHLGNVIDFNRKIPAINSMNHSDWAIVVAVAVFAFLCQIERFQGDYPNVILGSDLANITAMAMAYDHPGWFHNDFLLDNTDNFRIYFQLHVLLSRWLGTFLGNYNISLIVLLGPTIFIYLIGLYFLGRMVLKHRYWALIFMVVNAIPIYLVFETWGVVRDPAPRTAIQALLPYLLILAWKWREQPRLWVLIAIFTGLLVYVHAVGTPVWMAAILLGMWSQMPSTWPLFKRVVSAGMLGATMLLMGSVFIYIYLDNHVSGGIVNYSEMIQMYRLVLPPDILNVSGSTVKIIRYLLNMWLLPIGAVGTILLLILRRGQRNEVMMVLAWLAAATVISVIIPLIERVVEAYLRLLPMETELVRGVRYFIPLLSLLGLWGLGELHNRIKIPRLGILVAMIGLMLIHNVYQNRLIGELNFNKTVDCMKSGHLICAQKSDLQDVLTVLRDKTEPGSPVFFSDSAYDTLPLAVRYIAQRPLVYSYKDRGAGISDMDKLMGWYSIFSQLSAQESTTAWFKEDPQGLMDFVHNLDAKYLVLNMPIAKTEMGTLPANIFYENTTYTILELVP